MHQKGGNMFLTEMGSEGLWENSEGTLGRLWGTLGGLWGTLGEQLTSDN